MIKYSLSILCLLFSVSIKAQIFNDLGPASKIYNKVQYAKLPDAATGKKGHAFFNVSYDDYKKTSLAATEKILLDELAPFFSAKLAGSKFLYTDYQLVGDGISTSNNPANKKLIDTALFLVTATKNKQKWSWRSFKRILVPISTDTIYHVKASSLNSVQRTEIVYLFQLKNEKLNIHVSRGSNVVVEREVLPSTQIYTDALLLPVNELLIRQHYLLNSITPENINVMKTPDSVVMYSAIK